MMIRNCPSNSPVKMKLAKFAFVALVASTAAEAAPVVSVLGVPVGGKLSAQPKTCPNVSAGSADVRAICWAGQPQKYGKGKSGMAVIPGADKRPEWAAYATFDLRLADDGTVENLKAKTHAATDAPEIVRSISSRFGAPNENRARPISATWVRPDIYIQMLCSAQWCMVEFMSAASYAEWQQDLANRKKIDAARPISP